MSTNIELRNIIKSYGDVKVVHGIDLTINPGEFTVFVGPSGCGKSTLLRMIAGLEPITGGDLIIDDERMNDVPAARRGIAMVFQSYALYPHMNVYQNLAFGLETAKMPKAEIEQRVQKAAEILKIEPLLKRKPKQLSGGQRQRVAIGRAIVREPRIFLFDEPLSNLDAELRVQMRVEIAKLHNDLGNTMIYVTHDQVEAMTMADKIVVLRAGVIEQAGAPLELYNNPKNLFVAGFIGSPKMNFLTATSEGGKLTVAGNALEIGRAVDGATTLGVRPEHITLAEGSGTKLAEVRVDLVENLGGQTVVYATTKDNQPINIVLEGQRAVELGETVAVHIDPARLHLFNAAGDAI
ncbi:sn-glycerol-3-phosphate ABC transporter ATP-binding protein UgpC [Devosia sp. J2-20]|jgi:multiple sugar transport system ATP-binding protein|uniref:Sn-glycerol-3-phosphate ABC transporter ATP-binding protein UgpC n=1 Tax=Devosia litorisediminis TaxID=2829817 RepID=A0A942I7R9_9HYPH|nr:MULTISPECIES: sn-glycerol-3-phosphate ABC transporter ATP-binding protein UgpC [Devosia]MBS3850478.1 sn-glycerol-3-phosphate ABC transporter ATP-binding protein UgpC [Devosia litorisediminis]MCZ4347847.1 sn-glycerol-3-phosphate ABC transporter ATP-binding protein UgpC [Devosia neptuniae]WDR00227.1 sn-glycerol-3-phosphate ABC transporter ATP-binding protein UgpC [Devosia sp. J2-20]|tara:strand:+ start:1704 stop:2756 length:1053 start_codon:yes stop_codon:yes gene_type:complete